MRRIEDERIKFYLKHRQQIEEWLMVGQEVLPKFAPEFYASLLDDLCTEVRKSGSNVNIHKHVFGDKWQSEAIRLCRQCWPEAVSVELGWHRKGPGPSQVNFSSGQQGVWCGIWASEPYFEQLSNKRQKTPEYPKRWHSAGSGQPMYKIIDPPSGNFWEGNNLEEYGHDVIKTVLKAWCDLAPLVDEAVRSHNR